MRDTNVIGGNNHLDHGVGTFNERAWRRLYEVKRKSVALMTPDGIVRWYMWRDRYGRLVIYNTKGVRTWQVST